MLKLRVSDKIRGELCLSISTIALKAGQVIKIDKEAETSTEIQAAISNGFLVPANEKVITEELEIKEIEEETIDEDLEIEVKGLESNLSSYDMEKKELLDKGQSQKAAFDRSNTKIQMETQSGDDIDFNEETVEKPKIQKKVKKKAKKKAKKKSKKKVKKDTSKRIVSKLKKAAKDIQKNSIKPVGVKKEEPQIEKDTDEILLDSNKELSFVDDEQEKERILERRQRHPK